MTTNRNDNALKNELHIDPLSSQNSFQHILEASELPPPGPLYYAARRALWLKSPDNNTPRQISPSASRHKLENLLDTSDAIYSDAVWEGGIHKVWKGLSGGASLKRRLPMNLVVSRLSSIPSCIACSDYCRSKLSIVLGYGMKHGQPVEWHLSPTTWSQKRLSLHQ